MLSWAALARAGDPVACGCRRSAARRRARRHTDNKLQTKLTAELAAAAIHALEESMALSLDELVVEAARLLGFARVGRDIDAAVRRAVDTELDEMVEKDHLGRLRLRQDA